MRVSELINIKAKDISLTQPYTIRIYGKGNKGRYVPLMKTAVSHIQKYLSLMKYDNEARFEEYLFKNHMNSQFTRQGVNYVLKKYGTKARQQEPGLIPTDLTVHKMRHTAAMELITSGVDLMYIRDLLGHSSVMTTEIYDTATTELKKLLDKREAIRSQELIKAVAESTLSYKEVITFIRSGGTQSGETETDQSC